MEFKIKITYFFIGVSSSLLLIFILFHNEFIFNEKDTIVKNVIEHSIKFPYFEGYSKGNLLEPEEVVIAHKLRKRLKESNLILPYDKVMVENITQDVIKKEYENAIYEISINDYYKTQLIRVDSNYFEILIITKEYGTQNKYWVINPDTIYNVIFINYIKNDGSDTTIRSVSEIYPLRRKSFK